MDAYTFWLWVMLIATFVAAILLARLIRNQIGGGR